MIRLELVIVPVLLVVFVLVAIVSGIMGRRLIGKPMRGYRSLRYESLGDTGWFMGVIIGSVVSVFMVVILVLAAAPYSPHYWFFQERTGTIESISNRFVDASGDVSSGTYVLTLDGRPLVVDDARVLTYQVGDTISLNCLPNWVYGGADRYVCNIT